MYWYFRSWKKDSILDRFHDELRGDGLHHRRWHWKRFARGEKFLLRKWLRINDRWKQEEQVDLCQESPMIILNSHPMTE